MVTLYWTHTCHRSWLLFIIFSRYTEEDYLGSMGRRRALQEEPRAGRSEETIACQKVFLIKILILVVGDWAVKGRGARRRSSCVWEVN